MGINKRTLSPPARRTALCAGLLISLYGFVLAWALTLAGCADSTPAEPPYFEAAVRSSSNDATKCIELIEDGRVTLQGTKEDREQLVNRLYAIVKR